jgi:hypothetical protein
VLFVKGVIRIREWIFVRIIKDCGNDIWIIGLLKSWKLDVTGRIPNQAIDDQLVYVNKISDESNIRGYFSEVTAGRNLIMVVRGFRKSTNSCWDILFARND